MPWLRCISVIVVSAGMLSGCAGTEFAALRPSIAGIDKYSSAKGQPYDCANGDAQVRACAMNTLLEFSTLAKNGGDFDRDLGYVLVGAGTAAAAMGSNASPHTQAIKNIAVGVAALIGIHAIANTDGQRTILIQAQNTVTCLLRVYDSIGGAKSQLDALRAVSLDSMPLALEQNVSAHAQLAGTTATIVVAQQFAAISQAHTSTQRLAKAIDDADAARVKAFAEGLLEVRLYVQNNLDKPSQDLTGLFKMQKDNISKLTKDVTPQVVPNQVDAAVAARVGGITGVSSAQVQEVSANAVIAQKAADPIQSAVSSCSGS